MNAAERSRLVKMLALLGSDQVGERAAAGLLATELLKKSGVTWAQLLGVDLPTRETTRPASRPSSAHDPAEVARRYQAFLNDWEREFIASVGGRGKPLSPKQSDVLYNIYAGLRRRGAT